MEDNQDSTAHAHSALTPAEQFWEQIHHGKGRFGLVGALVLIWLLHTLLSRHLISGGFVTTQLQLLDKFEFFGTVLFVISTCIMIYAVLSHKFVALSKFIAVYLAYAVFQVVLNVIAMLGTANAHQGGGLTTLWDVGLVYLMSVLVFTFLYIFLDVTTPGGAFVWTARAGEKPPTPNFLDYMFISLNVSSTYGSTSEAIMSRVGKLGMAFQGLLAVSMLTVLIARAVASTS